MLLKRKKPLQRMIGLDLSLNSTGYAYEQSGQYVTGIIKPPKDLRGIARLNYNRNALVDVFLAANVSVAVIENYSMGSKGNVFNLGEWGGVARLVAKDAGCRVVVAVAPMTLKKLIAGRGNLPSGKAGKQVMVDSINRHLGVDIRQNDEADALSLYCIGSLLFNAKGPEEVSVRLKSQLKQKNGTGIDIEYFCS